MKTTFLSAILLLFLCAIGCKKENPSDEKKTYLSEGIAQKGPYKGATLTVKELNSELAQTGATFSAQTNDVGQYSIGTVSISGEYALLEVNGEFYNEFDSSTYLGVTASLKSLAKLAENEWNINIATHLVAERMIKLILSGTSPSVAKNQAADELSAIFFTPQSVFINANKLDIIGTSPDENNLLGISAILAAKINSPLSYDAYIRELTNDFKDNGKIDSPEMKMLIGTALELVRKEPVELGLIDWYLKNGAGTITPNMGMTGIKQMRSSGNFPSMFDNVFPATSPGGLINLFGAGDTIQVSSNTTAAIVIVPTNLTNVTWIMVQVLSQPPQNFTLLGGNWSAGTPPSYLITDMNTPGPVSLPIALGSPGEFYIQLAVLTKYSSLVVYPKKLVRWQ